MRETLRRIAAYAAIALGILHLGYGLFVFRAMTAEHIWFAGAGIAMILAGLSHIKMAAPMQAGLMVAYLGAMAFVLPLPQVFIGLGLFLTLLLTAPLKTYA